MLKSSKQKNNIICIRSNAQTVAVILQSTLGNFFNGVGKVKFSSFLNTGLFYKKKFIRKRGSNRQNLKKIVRKSRGSNSKIKCFYRPKIGNFVIIVFKMLKMEFKFKYTVVLTKV